MTVAVLFVCLGNICRSPLAEAAFRREAELAGLDFEVDSAGTGDWHIGAPPDPRAAAVAKANGLDISDLRARQVGPEDFHRFSHVIAMDAQNLTHLRRMQPEGSRARLSLLLDHSPGRAGEGVGDPYHGGSEHFDRTWDDVSGGARHLVRQLLADQAT